MVVSSSVFAQGSYMIEPYLGYYKGDFKRNSSYTDVDGFGYGARAGFVFTEIQLGLDYMLGTMEDNGTPKSSVKPELLGVFVGYKLPVLLRLFAVYFFNDKYKSGTHVYEGNEIKLGLGFTTWPLINLNIEYTFGKLDEDHGTTMGTSYKTNFFGLSLSAPFEF